MITAAAWLLTNVQGPGLRQAISTVQGVHCWTSQSLSQVACLLSRDGSTCWGHRFPHCSTGGNWSTSPSSVLSCSPRAKVSLYRSRTFSCKRGLQVSIQDPLQDTQLCRRGAPCSPMLSPSTWDRGTNPRWVLWTLPCLPSLG